MTSSLPVFARQRLSFLTDSGITNLLDSTNLLNQIEIKENSPDHFAYTIRVNPDAQYSADETQTLIGRAATGDKVQFVYTTTPDKAGFADAPSLQKLTVYFTNANGTFPIEETHEVNDVSYVFGPDLDGTVSIKPISEKQACVEYTYKVYGKEVKDKTIPMNLAPLAPVTPY